MSRRKIVINIQDPASIDNAIKEARAYRKWLKTGTTKLLRELKNYGVKVARVNFSNAIYAGHNDARVHGEMKGDTARVWADGTSVLFIEFGTGITKPDNPAERSAVISAGSLVEHGGYGHERAKNPEGWYFKKAGVRNAPEDTTPVPKHSGVYHTYGNAANSSLYNAREALIREFPAMARRAFSKDR